MYLRLFRRKCSEVVFAQLCKGNDVRVVKCLGTSDEIVAHSKAHELIEELGYTPESVCIFWDVPQVVPASAAR